MKNELWVDVSNHGSALDIGSFYQVSTLGAIRRKGSAEIKPSQDKAGYMVINLSVLGWQKSFRLQRIVAASFLGDPPSIDSQVNHKNGDKTDNRVENLEWSSPKENTNHAISTGLRIRSGAKLTEENVREIRALRAAKVKRRIVAEMFGVTTFNIQAIDLKKSWRNVV